MNQSYRSARFVLCATTALTFCSSLAHAQTTTPTTTPQALNLGSVVATGTQSGSTSTAPSATGSLKQAQELKKLAPNVISVQPQSQIQKNPDVNLADALARVPGVELVSDSGEGEFINIRGLDADLDATTYDSIHLTANVQSTPTGGGRATDLSAFPAGIVGGVEVTKSLTPEMDAEGLGGSVNLLPITLPADGSPLANITIAGGVETLRPTPIYQGSINLGGSFAIPGMRNFANAKPFSVIFAYTNYSDERGIDDVEEDYIGATDAPAASALQDLQLRYYQEHRVRQGFSTELDFNPSPQTGAFFRALHSGYWVDIQKDRLEISDLDGSNSKGGTLTQDAGYGNYTATGAVPSARYTFQDENVETDVLELGAHTVLGDFLSVDAKGSYEQGSDVLPYDYVTTFKYGSKKGLAINYSTASAEYRTYSVPSGVDLSNPDLYNLSSVANTPQRAFDQEFAAQSNASFADNILGGIGAVKFGVDAKLRAEGATQAEYDSTNSNTINLGNVSTGNPPLVYYNSHYQITPNAAYDELLPQVTFAANQDTSLSSYQHNSEDVYAAYAQQTLEFGKLEVLGGVRVEDTNGTYHAYLNVNANPTNPPGTVTTADGSVYEPNTNKQDYVDVFPSAQLKYAFSDQFQLRAAYSTAIARPGFQEISAAGTVDYSQSPIVVTVGNPSLKPTTGNSFDVTAEYYAPHDGLFTANAFYKLFNNYIYQTGYYAPFQGQTAQYTSYQNEAAFARGIELDAQQRFYFLPSPLDGLGFDGNVTLVDSRGRSDGPTTKAYQLPETSPVTYNAALSYTKGRFDLRVSANYVSRSLFQSFGTRDTDIFTSARTTVDADGAYNITKRLTFFVQARNLANSPLEFTQSASSLYPTQREFYNVDYLAGIRIKLGG